MLGAVSSGTHGTGAQIQNIASQIAGMRVLDAMGQIHIFNDTATPEIMTAFRINLGALGVITEVTVTVPPTILLKKTTKVLNSTSTYTQMYNQMAGLYTQHDRMAFWGPHFDWNAATQTFDIEPQYCYSY